MLGFQTLYVLDVNGKDWGTLIINKVFNTTKRLKHQLLLIADTYKQVTVLKLNHKLIYLVYIHQLKCLYVLKIKIQMLLNLVI